jgi:predicted methyltransferase
MGLTSMLNEGGWRLIALALALCLIVAPIAACAGGGEESGEPAAGAAADAGEPAGQGEEAEGEHEHGAPADIPSRAEEMARDEYSKPQEVFDFLGIGAGATVVDINAFTGYNTYLLAERVGDSGRVYAERGNEALRARMEHGDLAGAGNIVIPESWATIPDGSVDAIIAIREYHLVRDYEALLANMMRVLKPGGVVGVVEVRLNEAHGHDMDTHRMGEQTIIEQFQEGGFEYAGDSDILRRDDDDYTTLGGPQGVRYITDRMLLKFARPQ